MSHEKALEYLSGAFDAIPNADELLQLVELEFIRKDAVQNAQNKVSRLLVLKMFPPRARDITDIKSRDGIYA